MIKLFICRQKCFWKETYYREGTYHEFDDRQKIPKHFVPVEPGSPVLKEVVEELEDKIQEDKKLDHPHPSITADIRRNQKRVEELNKLNKGQVSADLARTLNEGK